MQTKRFNLSTPPDLPARGLTLVNNFNVFALSLFYLSTVKSTREFYQNFRDFSMNIFPFLTAQGHFPTAVARTQQINKSGGFAFLIKFRGSPVGVTFGQVSKSTQVDVNVILSETARGTGIGLIVLAYLSKHILDKNLVPYMLIQPTNFAMVTIAKQYVNPHCSCNSVVWATRTLGRTSTKLTLRNSILMNLQE